MKSTGLKQSRKGFTLVELLVVISIIAVLAALGGGAAVKALNKSRELAAQQAATSIVVGIQNFYDEYGTYPVTGTTSNDFDGRSDENVMNHLLGLDTSINTKGIRFVSIKEGKGKKGGIIYEGGGNTATLTDPWGEEYYVVMDGNFDEELQGPNDGSSNQTIRGKRAIAYSGGGDKDPNTRKDNSYSYK